MPNNNATRLVLDEVALERQRQEDKWGQQNHEPFKWMTILMEEVGEAAKDALENKSTYRDELVQAAAVAVAAIEGYDRNGDVQ